MESKIKGNGFEGTIFTYEAEKVAYILNEVLKKPSSALIVEPAKNEYWVFYNGGYTFPQAQDSLKVVDLTVVPENFKASVVEKVKGAQWDMVKIEVEPEFLFTINDEFNKIKNLSSIRVAIHQGDDGKRFVHLYYKN
ncbi:hypothetical protein ACFQ3S_07720 [Mucilaginibacter terrae]|uniref:hypothetical protein n=1 Tax=Mucilaginibacter terrae TaxID=1955052 RepID=UPI003628178D